MNLETICTILVVIVGLLSSTIAYLVIEMKEMRGEVKNSTPNRSVEKQTKSYKIQLEEIRLDNEELVRKNKFLEEEINIIKDSRKEYAYALSDLEDCYDSACNTLNNLLQEGLLIKNVSSTDILDDLLDRGDIEVYNRERNFNVTKQEIRDIFGTDIFIR